MTVLELSEEVAEVTGNEVQLSQMLGAGKHKIQYVFSDIRNGAPLEKRFNSDAAALKYLTGVRRLATTAF